MGIVVGVIGLLIILAIFKNMTVSAFFKGFGVFCAFGSIIGVFGAFFVPGVSFIEGIFGSLVLGIIAYGCLNGGKK